MPPRALEFTPPTASNAMKTLCTIALSSLTISLACAADPAAVQEGKAEFKSMGPMAFGPDGTLFIADTKSAAITALATNDTKAAGAAKPVKIEDLTKKVGALLGTGAGEITINDISVHPLSHRI